MAITWWHDYIKCNLTADCTSLITNSEVNTQFAGITSYVQSCLLKCFIVYLLFYCLKTLLNCIVAMLLLFLIGTLNSYAPFRLLM